MSESFQRTVLRAFALHGFNQEARTESPKEASWRTPYPTFLSTDSWIGVFV